MYHFIGFQEMYKCVSREKDRGRCEWLESKFNSLPTLLVPICGTKGKTQLSAGMKGYEASEDLKV